MHALANGEWHGQCRTAVRPQCFFLGVGFKNAVGELKGMLFGPTLKQKQILTYLQNKFGHRFDHGHHPGFQKYRGCADAVVTRHYRVDFVLLQDEEAIICLWASWTWRENEICILAWIPASPKASTMHLLFITSAKGVMRGRIDIGAGRPKDLVDGSMAW